ncbi:MAG TPA: hypothetical protein VMH34_02665 [Gammaproteobacteria bacterium]|nr:hypothetical protein [Gammaproteobacteria bacterium]
MRNGTPPNIIDIEASGFGPHSYPIEVGVALSTGEKFCSLILPMQDWTHWDEQAEGIHRISREILLTHGQPIDRIAENLNKLLREATAYSDGWVVDQTWLTRLFHAARIRREFSFSPLELILSEPQMDVWHNTKNVVLREVGNKRHRASIDAYVIQQTFERTRRTVPVNQARA